MNDKTEEFRKEVSERITDNTNDKALVAASKKFVEESARAKYVYNFSWMGRPIIQYPQDILAMQELIWEIKPDLIIEAGIAHGGSLIFSASMLELNAVCGGPVDAAVLGIDIDIRAHNKIEIEKHPMHSRITMIEGSSIDSDIIDRVHKIASGKSKILVCLDSNHTKDHVLAELEAYASLVTVGSYCVVFDTIVEHLSDEQLHGRPWGRGNSPMTAVHAYLESHPEFETDTGFDGKLMVSVSPQGFLKRTGLRKTLMIFNLFSPRKFNPKKPFFSLIIPTRDRPEFVKYSLEVNLSQTFQNFEIIVSDNAVNAPCLEVVKAFDDPRIKYVKPETPLPMAEHWEFACAQATGKYISVLSDKTFLHPGSLDSVYETLLGKKYDLVTWSNEMYVPVDEPTGYTPGYYNPQKKITGPHEFSPQEELTRRMDCREDLWKEGNNYYRGKIHFGAYSAKLVARIMAAQGCLFPKICPDYTSTAAALALAKNAVDMGQPFRVSFLLDISNGRNYYNSPTYARNFLDTSDPSGAVYDELPVKNLFASTHNLIAGDYLRIKRNLGERLFPWDLNYENLIERVITDLAVIGFESEEQLQEHVAHLLEFRPELDKAELLNKIQLLREKKPRSAGRSAEEKKAIYERAYTKFDTPLEMAVKMMEHYQNQAERMEIVSKPRKLSNSAN